MKTLKKGAFILLAGSLLLSGCGGEEISDYDRIHKRLSEMTGYKAECSVTYYSDMTESTYMTKQMADEGGRYRIETVEPEKADGISILFDGNMIWLYNPVIRSKVQVASGENDKRREIVLFTFLKNEASSGEETTVSAASLDGEKYLTLEASIPGDDSEYSTEKLFVDIKSGDPKRLVIYNSKGGEHIVEEFESFEYNPEFLGDEFKISAMLEN